MDFELLEELEGKVGMHQGSVVSPCLFAVVVDATSEFARNNQRSEILCADDLVLMMKQLKVFP